MALTYLKWNDLLAKHFFSEEKASKEVLLYVNESLIQELGKSFDEGVPEFVEAVKNGPPWTNKQGLCQKALEAFENWRSRELAYPPYIGYLALFVLAGGKGGEYAPHAYYPRLWDLLGETGEKRPPPSFERMIILWDDLEKWSREDQQENFGRFVARIRGNWWKVGLPLSQRLISEDERKALPRLLIYKGFDPADLPSPEVIMRILQEEGPSLLERRTVRVLTGEDDDSKVLRKALLEVVIEELESWDGTVIDESSPVKTKKNKAYLRLCLKLNKLSQSATCRVRIKSTINLPEEGCKLQQMHTQHIWRCEECFGGWSNTLYDPDTKPVHELNGTQLNWSQGEQFFDEDNRWIVTLQPANIRVFTPGSPDGLPGYVERNRLERNTRFLVAARDNYIPRVREWGNQYCLEFQEFGNAGLPSDWALFLGKNPSKSCSGIDVLTISSLIRLHVRGGVKTGHGNTYLKVAPPRIILENATGEEYVTLNGKPLEENEEHSQIWQIPNNAPVEEPLHIEAITGEEPKRKIIRLEYPNLPDNQEYKSFQRNPAGVPQNGDAPYASGAIVCFPQQTEPPPFPKPLPLHLSSQVTIIGSVPGQVSVLPHDPMPDWHPVWAIIKTGRKRAKVFFCGTEEQATNPYNAPEPLNDKASVNKWKEIVWYYRKRVISPELRAHKERWKEYMEAGRYV